MPSPNARAPKVFISYSQESGEHRLRVYHLVARLRANGIDCVSDHTVYSPVEGWRAWMEERIKEADYTLIVCTETYRRRAERREEPGKGLGVTWEAAIITDEIYQNAGRNTRFIPVIFEQADAAHILDRLKQYTYYRVDSEEGWLKLLRHLTNQPEFEEVPLGMIPELRPLNLAPFVSPLVQPPLPTAEKAEPLSAAPSAPSAASVNQPEPPTIVQARPAQPQSFSEDLGNGVKLEMVYLPGGEFLMGSPEGKGEANEHPQHEVTVAAFYIGKYQITQAQWQAVMGGNPADVEGDDLPKGRVSWREAKDFCDQLSQMTGKPYRLPSEAEWEYACRAGTTGDYAGKLEQMAWYEKNSEGRAHPVGQKKPNAFGLYDMHGNGLEWCEDDWHGNYVEAPKDGSAWLDRGNSMHRVMRSSAWILEFSTENDCRSAFREPGEAEDLRGECCGLRVVISASISQPFALTSPAVGRQKRSKRY